MKTLLHLLSAAALLWLASCGGGSRQIQPETAAADGLTDRLNRSYGYEVDEGGNWVPKNDKRSQYEGRGGSAYFSGDVGKKAFQTNKLNKGSWMGGKEFNSKTHRLSGSDSNLSSTNRFSSQQASLDRSLQTPARINGNRFPDQRAIESGAGDIAKPSNAITDHRRKVFNEPEIIDYRQQRELSIRESRRLLGRDED